MDGGFSGEDFANHEIVLCKDMDDEVVKRSATARGMKCSGGARWWSGSSGGSCNVGTWSGFMNEASRSQLAEFMQQ